MRHDNPEEAVGAAPGRVGHDAGDGLALVELGGRSRGAEQYAGGGDSQRDASMQFHS